MENVRAASTTPGTTPVGERRAGRRPSSDAFRRAMADLAGEDARDPDLEPSLPRELQVRRSDSRRGYGEAYQVDVLA